MQVLDLTLPSLPENLALDEALLLQAEAGAGPEVLRLWEWQRPAVVLGSAGRLVEDVEVHACRQDAVPIGRRASGGGTVLLASGCLCFSLVLAYDRSPALQDIRPSYRYILERLADGLAGLLPELAPAGTSDLPAGGQKFSGDSQQRKRSYLLHHGTLLYDFDLSLLSRYLRIPSRQPDYRRNRAHADFLTSLPCDARELKGRLRSAWDATRELRAWPETLVRTLTAEKYATAEWVHRR